MKQFPPGLYDILHTKKLHKQLENAGLLDKAVWEKLGMFGVRVKTITTNL